MDLSKIKDVKDLQSLLDLMARYDLLEIELESEGRKIRVRRGDPEASRHVIYSAAPPLPAMVPGQPAPAAVAAPGAGAPVPAAPSNLRDVASPMVGTFYRAASPEAEPFVKEGDIVDAETVLCIIEAMKVMNEIPAGISGVVREILVKNGESVEYGQPLFRVEVE
jgi:acetyl-CoA carboxylase biotin carboxyl carrier protein